MNAIDEYIMGHPPEVQLKLKEMRSILKEVLPEAEEVINYGIPTFQIKGKNVVHFGGAKKHIGFYPGASGVAAFKEELSVYKGAKGSVQFLLDQPLPKNLIQRITQFRIAENQKKYKL